MQPTPPSTPSQATPPADTSQPTVVPGRARPAEVSKLRGPVEDVLEPPVRKRIIDGRLGTAVIVLIVIGVVGMSYRVVSHTITALQPVPGPTVTVTVGASGQASGGPASGASLSAGPNDPSGVPMPKGDIPGWHQTFFDDFTGTKLSKKWVAYNGQPRGNTAKFKSSRVSVGDGMLTINAKRSKGVFTTGGISNVVSFSQTYGKFDVRFRMDKGWGVAYAILLWPQNDAYWPEIDFAEDNGGDRTMTSASLHTINKDNIHKETHGDYTTWHTAEVTWSPGKLVYSLDGKVWATTTGKGVPDSTKMVLAIQTEVHACGGTWENCPNKTTPSSVNLQVDWVAIYSAAKN